MGLEPSSRMSPATSNNVIGNPHSAALWLYLLSGVRLFGCVSLLEVRVLLKWHQFNYLKKNLRTKHALIPAAARLHPPFKVRLRTRLLDVLSVETSSGTIAKVGVLSVREETHQIEEAERFCLDLFPTWQQEERIREAKPSAAAEHTRQELIRKQLSHLQDIKDVTRGENTTFPCQVAAHYSPNKQEFLYQSKVIQSSNETAIYQH